MFLCGNLGEFTVGEENIVSSVEISPLTDTNWQQAEPKLKLQNRSSLMIPDADFLLLLPLNILKTQTSTLSA